MPASSNRRPSRRSFRPAADARLEQRMVLSSASPVTLHQYLTLSDKLLNNPSVRPARLAGFPAFTKDAPGIREHPRTIYAPAIQTARGGQAVNVVTNDGSRFRIQLSYVSNTQQVSAAEGAAGAYAAGGGGPALGLAQPMETPQPQGTVRVYPRADGSVGIIVDGSTANTELTINPLPRSIKKGFAHSFAYGQADQSRVLDVSSITINSGNVAAILGFHTADLTGPVVVSGTQAIDRIAFRSVKAGGSITTGGDLNTLDVLNGLDLSGGGFVSIGRDLNLLNVGGTLSIQNGSAFNVGRDVGLVPQPPKGTGTGSNVLSLNYPILGTQTSQQFPPVSAYVQGDMIITPGGAFNVGRKIDSLFQVQGALSGNARFHYVNGMTPVQLPDGSFVQPPAVVARGGITP